MVDTDHATVIRLSTSRLQDVQVGKCKPMVFVVIGQEGQRRVLMLDLGVEHCLVPAQHLLEAAGAVDDVHELDGADA